MSLPDVLLGSRAVAHQDLTRPWPTSVRTSLVTLADGRRVVVQSGAATAVGRAGIGRRVRLASAVRTAAPGLPVPDALDGDAGAGHPWLALRHVPGQTGDELLASPAGAALLGAIAGAVGAELAAVRPARLGRSLARTWSAPDRLGAAAARWLGEAASDLGAARVAAVRPVLERVPTLFVSPPVVAHGDLAPVNLVVDGGRLAGVLDLERLRLAPAGFDAAWFRLLVRHHHPSAWPSAGPALLAAVGLPDDEATTARLDDLAALACLEALADLPRRDRHRAAWTTRLDEVLRGAR